MPTPNEAQLDGLYETDVSGAPTLLGSRCERCGRCDLPARSVCLTCGSRAIQGTRLSGRGTVHESTTVARPPAGFRSAYAVGLIDLDEGPRLFALLSGPYPHGSRVHVVASTLPSGQHAFAFEIDGD